MIISAEEFVSLRSSSNPENYLRSINESTTLEIWFEIIHDYQSMREWVVLNKTIPLEVLETLINDNDPAVRRNIAMKNKLTRNMFDSLIEDKDASVRNRLIYNKNIPKDLLQKLASDKELFVRENAINKIKES